MEGARAIIINIYPDIVEDYSQFLVREDHKLVDTATTLEETFVMVGQLRCKGKVVDLAMVDLDEEPNNPANSIEAAKMIKEELGVDVHVISTSSVGQFEGADVHFDTMELEAIRVYIRDLKRVRP